VPLLSQRLQLINTSEPIMIHLLPYSQPYQVRPDRVERETPRHRVAPWDQVSLARAY